MRVVSTCLFVTAVLPLSVALAQTIYVAPDVPTDLDGTTTYLPWNVVRHVSGGPTIYDWELGLPDMPAIDAMHRLDTGDWLFSIEAPSRLGGFLDAAPEDVFLSDGNWAVAIFDGSCVSGAVPPGVGVDAISGVVDEALFVSFDVPATIGGTTYMPSALVRYTPTGMLPCGWTLSGQEIDFRDPPTTLWNPAGANVIGVARAGSGWIVSFDVPVDLAPSTGPTTYLPGQIAFFDGVTWSLYEDLQTEGMPGWPVSSQVAALSCQANPGRIDPAAAQIAMHKTGGSMLEIQCPTSCSVGAERYGLYEGSLTNLRSGIYDHVQIGCSVACPGATPFVPTGGGGDRYYLVVPHNVKEEGSYGQSFIAGAHAERPQAVSTLNRCAIDQSLAACP